MPDDGNGEFFVGAYSMTFNIAKPKNRGGGAKKRRGSAWKGLGKREPDPRWIGLNFIYLKEYAPYKASIIKAWVSHTLLMENKLAQKIIRQNQRNEQKALNGL